LTTRKQKPTEHELEACEEAEDLAAGRKALAEIAAGEKPVPWEQVKAELDAI